MSPGEIVISIELSVLISGMFLGLLRGPRGERGPVGFQGPKGEPGGDLS